MTIRPTRPVPYQWADPQGPRRSRAPYNFVPLPEAVVTVLQGEEWKGKTGAELESLLDERLPRHDRFVPGRNSGHFDVTLTVRSLLYIRAALTAAEFQNDETGKYADGGALPGGHQNPEFRRMVKNISRFFSTWDDAQPVIPGSSLRGMLRTLVEIVGYSKVQWVTDKKMLYRAVGDPSAIGDHYRNQVLGSSLAAPAGTRAFNYPSPSIRGGYLTRLGREWAIQPAQSPPGAGGETIAHVPYTFVQPLGIPSGKQASHPVYIAPAARAPSTRPGLRNGNTLVLRLAQTTSVSDAPALGLVPACLVVSGHMGGGHEKHWHCAIYEPDPAAPQIPIPATLWEAYQEDLDSHTQSKPRPLVDGEPLFYMQDAGGNLVFFGHTMMFRLRYQDSPLDLVPPELRRPEDVDLAESLFGFVRTRKELGSIREHYGEPKQGSRLRAYKGRVSVSSAILDPPNQTGLYSGTQDLAILSGPKATCFQHYLVQNDETRRDLKHYDSSMAETAIRGHKLYWRKGNVEPESISPRAGSPGCLVNGRAIDNSTQHTQANPVSPGRTFTFRVDFANLTDAELGALCWVLEPLGLPGKEYAHSLGMGRPLGMGSIKLEPVLHLVDRAERYKKLFDDDGGWHLGSSEGDISTYRAAFEQWILNELGKTAVPHLNDLERIQCLLALMEWPGRLGDREAEYAELKEFKTRPVLPPPIVMGPPSSAAAGTTAHVQRRGTSPSPRGGSAARRAAGREDAAQPKSGHPPKTETWKSCEVNYSQGCLCVFHGKKQTAFDDLGLLDSALKKKGIKVRASPGLHKADVSVVKNGTRWRISAVLAVDPET